MSQQEFISTAPEFVTNEAPAAETLVEELDRQTAQGAMHAHTVGSQLAERLHIVESMLYGLVDLLVNKSMVAETELAAAASRVAQAIEERGERAHGGVALRVDPPDDQPFTPVNCAERIPVCKAICCRLSFPLTAEEVQSGQLKWDLGRPYFIRHNAQGACVHQESATGACGVYSKRPSLCKSYSCATDTRIWKDFDNMTLNQEWIDEHLSAERPQLIQIRMDAT
jgi:Fe-S-cluster containining protein